MRLICECARFHIIVRFISSHISHTSTSNCPRCRSPPRCPPSPKSNHSEPTSVALDHSIAPINRPCFTGAHPAPAVVARQPTESREHHTKRPRAAFAAKPNPRPPQNPQPPCAGPPPPFPSPASRSTMTHNTSEAVAPSSAARPVDWNSRWTDKARMLRPARVAGAFWWILERLLLLDGRTKSCRS
jgi:hypothetical protein